MSTDTLLEVLDLHVEHALKGASRLGAKERVSALDGVSFHIARHETLAVVGASGAGKTTLAKALLRLVPIARGSLRYHANAGEPPIELDRLEGRALRHVRPDFGIVFQDPLASLNPRMRARAVIAEALNVRAARADTDALTLLALEQVGLSRAHQERFPHELSGGERQRLCLARALATEPRLLVLDEALASLDVSIQAQIGNLLVDLRRERALSIVYITHDLGLVRWLADRVAVLDRGRIVEIGAVDRVFASPESAVTRALLSARMAAPMR